MFRTQLAFRYSLSIFLTSGNRAVNGEQISVTTFSGVKEHLMCSKAASFQLCYFESCGKGNIGVRQTPVCERAER
jgi:hypothetical protein